MAEIPDMMKRYIAFSIFWILSLPMALAQSLSGVESVEYDPVNGQYLTSSDGTSIVAIAPNGALSHFGTGLQADYGMEVVNGTLFTIVGGSVKGYDLTSATEVMAMPISGAGFLNGMGNNGTDRLWVSDFSAKKIYEVDISNLNSPSYTTVVSNTVSTPNGIVHDDANNRILFVNWGSNAAIKAVDLTGHGVSNVVANTGLGNIDGIDKDSEGNWYISSWSPARITKYGNDFSTTETITVPGISNPADICYAPETDTLAIPGGNQVLFVGFESSSVGLDGARAEDPFRVHYHDGFPIVRFELHENQDAVFEILDQGGQNVYTVLEGPQTEGLHSVVLSSIGLYPGAYLCRLSSKELTRTERIIIP